MNNVKCTILVNSCDKYSEAWPPFFQLFRKYWKECPYDVTLNTETKVYSDYNVKTINVSGNWGERLHGALEQIDTPYVLFMLEDFFLQREVNADEIERCIRLLDENEDYACFYYKRTTGYEHCEIRHGNYLLMQPYDDTSLYLFNAQAGLWRREVLMEAVKRISTPWELEVEGYKLCRDIVDKYSFFCHKESYYDKVRDIDVISYVVKRETGMGIYRSKWLWNNKKFFKKEGIACDMKELGTMSFIEVWYKESLIPFLFRVKQAIKRRVYRLTGRNE